MDKMFQLIAIDWKALHIHNQVTKHGSFFLIGCFFVLFCFFTIEMVDPRGRLFSDLHADLLL